MLHSYQIILISIRLISYHFAHNMTPSSLHHLIQQVGLKASVFYSGGLCGQHPFVENDDSGHLHVIMNGPFDLVDRHGQSTRHQEPSLILFKAFAPHHLNIPPGEEAQVMCADIAYGSGMDNIITTGLPDIVLIPLSQLPLVCNTLNLLSSTAQLSPLIRQPIDNKLCEVILLQVIAHLIENGKVNKGALSGLANPVLGSLLAQIIQQPGYHWEVEKMAQSVAMSKTRFTQQFIASVGEAPGQFVRRERIRLAKTRLLEGKPLDLIAQHCGYASQSSFSRAFMQQTGQYPSHWAHIQNEMQRESIVRTNHS
jgi:AraC-like DNA-binding protein